MSYATTIFDEDGRAEFDGLPMLRKLGFRVVQHRSTWDAASLPHNGFSDSTGPRPFQALVRAFHNVRAGRADTATLLFR